MAVAVPTVEDAHALYDFIMARVNEEWETAMGDETLTPDALTRFCRISNSNKMGVTGLTAYVVALLPGDDDEQAALAWDHLTAAGEEWRDHPDHLPVWENVARAKIRATLAGEPG